VLEGQRCSSRLEFKANWLATTLPLR
jgi:hypothetical protein